MDAKESALLATLLGRSEKLMNSEQLPQFDFEFNTCNDDQSVPKSESVNETPLDIKGDTMASRVMKPTSFDVCSDDTVDADDQPDDDLLQLMDSWTSFHHGS